MKYRTYPGSDVTVSEVGFGLWTISTGWWGEHSDEDAVRMLHEAYDLGVTFFDAADSYGNGRSEELLAKAFAGRRREVVYATKFGYDFYHHGDERRGQNELPQDLSPGFVRYALEQSLRRMQTDCIDIYQIHNAKLEHVYDDALWSLLEDLRREGKIRMFGVALGPAIGWLVESIEAVRRRNVASQQIIWNLLEQFPGDEMVQAAYQYGSPTGYQVRVPHASGMLEGKYSPQTVFPPNDHRNHRPKSWLINGCKKVEALRFLERDGRTLGQASIQWLLREPRVVSVLPNVYDGEQLREFAASSSDVPALTDAEYDRVQALAKTNFGVVEDPMNYKGTMDKELVSAHR